MDSTNDATLDLEALDAWLTSDQAGLQNPPPQEEVVLPPWLEQALQDPPQTALSSSADALQATHSGSGVSQTPSQPSPSSEALQKLRQKNRLAQQRSRKRRNEQLHKLEVEVQQLKKLLAAERQRNRTSSLSLVERSDKLSSPHETVINEHNLDRGSTHSDESNKQQQVSASMSRLLSSLADVTLDDRFFPLLGRHFGSSAEIYRWPLNHSWSAFQGPDAAISWPITFTEHSNHFVRARGGRQLSSTPSLIVVPELVLYKVCRFYFRLLLPFSTSSGSGIVDLNTAEILREPETVFTRSEQTGDGRSPRTRGLLDEDGNLPEVLMPTRLQRMLGPHPIEIAVIPFATLRDKVLLTVMALNGKQDFKVDTPDEPVVPDKDKIYEFTFSEKPSSAHPHQDTLNDLGITEEPNARQDPLCPAARRWLDTFMIDFVSSLRVWNASDDCFNTTALELRPHFVSKYGHMLDVDIIKTSNFWRRSRGEPRLPTG